MSNSFLKITQDVHQKNSLELRQFIILVDDLEGGATLAKHPGEFGVTGVPTTQRCEALGVPR